MQLVWHLNHGWLTANDLESEKYGYMRCALAEVEIYNTGYRHRWTVRTPDGKIEGAEDVFGAALHAATAAISDAYDAKSTTFVVLKADAN